MDITQAAPVLMLAERVAEWEMLIMLRKIAQFFCLIYCTIGPVLCAEPAHFYVAVDGNDDWSGQVDRPNADRSDGPFKTIERAQRRARLARLDTGRGYTIFVRNGRYYLDRTLEFGPDDSGSVGSPTILRAYPGERPVISGGLALTQWRQRFDGKWVARLPSDLLGQGWKFSSIYVDGQRRRRPRWPLTGYSKISEGAPRIRVESGERDQFVFADGDIRSEWNLTDAEVLVFHYWTTTRAFIADLKRPDRLVTLSGRAWSTKPYGQLSKGRPYIIENVREAQQPGEWYFDRETEEVVYRPLPGESVGSLDVVVPRLETLLSVGALGEAKTADIQVVGLTFAHTNWALTAKGLSSGQSESALQSAVKIQNASGVRFEQIAILHTGGYGIAFDSGSRNSSISECVLRDLGGGGLRIGTSSRTDTQDAAMSVSSGKSVGRINVHDCTIASGGRLHPASVGIWIGDAEDCEIAHNSISDFYYSGISVGWTWGYKESRAVRNRIYYNRIQHIGKGRMSDLGGIYTLGVSPGTIVSGNYISDVRAREYGGWGLYADEGTSGVHFINNIVREVGNTGFMIHFGRNNLVSNNIFAGGKEGAIRCNVPESPLSAIFQSNVLLYQSGTYPLVDRCDRSTFKFDSNIIWNTSANMPPPMGDWKFGTREDMHARLVDPQFINMEDGDYRLKMESALKIEGFAGVDALNAGSRTSFEPLAEPPVLEGYD